MKGEYLQLLYGAYLHDTPAGTLHSGTMPGLNDAVASMKQGGRRLILLPPTLGYGRFSEPPNMTLLVEAELVQVGNGGGVLGRLRSRLARLLS